MNPEIKKALLWMAPSTVDGNPVGAIVRSAESIAVGIGAILAFHALGADCAGWIAAGVIGETILQCAACAKYYTNEKPPWQKWRE